MTREEKIKLITDLQKGRRSLKEMKPVRYLVWTDLSMPVGMIHCQSMNLTLPAAELSQYLVRLEQQDQLNYASIIITHQRGIEHYE